MPSLGDAYSHLVVLIGIIVAILVVSSTLIVSRDRWAPYLSDRRKLLLRALGGGVLAIAIAIAVGHIDDLEELFRKVEQGDHRWLAVGIGFEALSFAGYMWMARIIFKPEAPKLTDMAVVELTLAGVVATRVFSAGGAGGIAFTGWVLGRAGMGTRVAARQLAAFLALVYSVYMVVLFVGGLVVAFGLVEDVPQDLGIVAALVGGTVIAAAVAIVWIPSDLEHRVEESAKRPEAGKWAKRAAAVPQLAGNAMRTAFEIARHRPVVMLGATAWWLFDIAVLWATFHAFAAPPPIATIVLCYFLGMLGNLLPLPGGVGGKEGGMVGAFAACGVSPSLAVLAVLSYQVISTYLPVLPGLGAYVLLRRRMKSWGDAEELPALP
jgi:uncharacterized protein (TIRG00374 family)